eukprot:Nk52_evm50s78 gene=Nk52_evmTU50s78
MPSKNAFGNAKLDKEKYKLKVSFKTKRTPQPFWQAYLDESAIDGKGPILKIQKDAESGALDINCDRIWAEEWPPLLRAIAYSRDVTRIALHSKWRHRNRGVGRKSSSDDPEVGEHYSVIYNHTRKTQKPFIQSPQYSYNLIKALTLCFSCSHSLTHLSLNGIEFSSEGLNTLSMGISNGKSIKHLDMSDTPLKDEGLHILSPGLRKSRSIVEMNFTSCKLTSNSREDLGTIVKSHVVYREVERWKDSLRYRQPSMEHTKGLQRLTLCCNPELGDNGIRDLCETMQDELWLKALDVQYCGITNEGAKFILKNLKLNRWINIIDIRKNSVDDDIMKELYTRLNLNNGYQKDLQLEPPNYLKEACPSCPFKWMEPIVVSSKKDSSSAGQKRSTALNSARNPHRGSAIFTPVFVPASSSLSKPIEVPGTRFVKVSTKPKRPQSAPIPSTKKSYATKLVSSKVVPGRKKKTQADHTVASKISSEKNSDSSSVICEIGKSPMEKSPKKKRRSKATRKKVPSIASHDIQARISLMEKKNETLKQVLDDLRETKRKLKAEKPSKKGKKKKGSKKVREGESPSVESNIKTLLQKEKLFSLIESTFNEFHEFIDNIKE